MALSAYSAAPVVAAVRLKKAPRVTASTNQAAVPKTRRIFPIMEPSRRP